jgi:hypothetical protein
VTVPTNNEEREALIAIRDAYDRAMDVRPVCDDDFYAAVQEALNRVCDSDGNFIVRRPPVSGDNSEARKRETGETVYEVSDMSGILRLRGDGGITRAEAEPREAAPSDSDRELKAERLRQLAASYRMDLKSPSTAAMLDDAADTLSRTSHPVQVEAAPSDTDREALIEEAERVYDGAVLHDDVDYEVGLIQRLGLALARSPHAVQVEAAPSDPHMGVEHESYCHLQHGLGGKCNCTSQPVQVEVAPSDVDGVLAMLDGLNASGGIAYDDYSRLHDAVALLAPDEPVRVEVTDDMVRRADAAYWKSANDCDDHADPMRDALVAALGGGE